MSELKLKFDSEEQRELFLEWFLQCDGADELCRYTETMGDALVVVETKDNEVRLA